MDGEVVVDAGVPVDEAAVASIVDGSDFQLQVLPAGRYAAVTHHGHVDRLQEVNAALMAWAEEQGVAWDVSDAEDGQHWACRLETYLTNPVEQPDPEKWETVIAAKTA